MACLYPLLFLSGASTYALIELLWRGRTHSSMALAGGVCMLLLYGIHTALPGAGLVVKSLLGTAAVTLVELLCGYIVNLRLKLNVWDYTGLPWQFRGQICLPYSAAWFLLCLPIFIWLSNY